MGQITAENHIDIACENYLLPDANNKRFKGDSAAAGYESSVKQHGMRDIKTKASKASRASFSKSKMAKKAEEIVHQEKTSTKAAGNNHTINYSFSVIKNM